VYGKDPRFKQKKKEMAIRDSEMGRSKFRRLPWDKLGNKYYLVLAMAFLLKSLCISFPTTDRDFFFALESKAISATSTSAHVPLLSLVPAVIY
jgi:hypothetical protein